MIGVVVSLHTIASQAKCCPYVVPSSRLLHFAFLLLVPCSGCGWELAHRHLHASRGSGARIHLHMIATFYTRDARIVVHLPSVQVSARRCATLVHMQTRSPTARTSVWQSCMRGVLTAQVLGGDGRNPRSCSPSTRPPTVSLSRKKVPTRRRELCAS